MKYIKETLTAITSQQWLAYKEEANDIIEIKKQKKKEQEDNNNTQCNKHNGTEIEEKRQ